MTLCGMLRQSSCRDALKPAGKNALAGLPLLQINPICRNLVKTTQGYARVAFRGELRGARNTKTKKPSTRVAQRKNKTQGGTACYPLLRKLTWQPPATTSGVGKRAIGGTPPQSHSSPPRAFRILPSSAMRAGTADNPLGITQRGQSKALSRSQTLPVSPSPPG